MSKKLVSLFLALALVLACVPVLAEGGITVTDMTGREIVLDGPASKIVALTASDVEILYALGAGDLLVGRGEYCDYPAEALEKPSVQSGYETNLEEIISLEPDVVIMATMAQTEEQVEELEKAGIRVIVSDAQDLEGVYTAITLIGQVVGKNDEAAALKKEMTDTFVQISAKAPSTGKTIYFEVSAPYEGSLWAAGSNTFMDELAALCGLSNIFADQPAWVQASEEQVIERNPDYIVTTAMYGGNDEAVINELKTRAGWENVTAIKDGNVFGLESNQITRPGPRLMDAIKALYELVYGAEEEAPAA